MLVTDRQRTFEESSDTVKLELYRLIGEGYKALQDGRVSTIDQVRKRLEEKRKQHG